MKNQRVLIVGGANEMFAYRTASCLHDAGYEVVAAMAKSRSTLRSSGLVNSVARFDASTYGGDREALSVAMSLIVAEHEIDVVFPVDLPTIEALASGASHLLVPVVALPEPDVVASCHDKSRFAEVLSASDIAQPAEPVVIATASEIDDLDPALFVTPRFVKQVDGDGGIGVARVDSIEELADHVASGRPGTAPPLLLQEFVPGHDIDCSFYAEGGEMLAFAVQTRVAQTDPTVTFVVDDRVSQTCGAIVEALGYDGLGHADLRIDDRDGRVVAIELNPRVWGSVHYALAAGVNFPALAVSRALRETEPSLDLELGPVTNPDVDLKTCLKALVGMRISAPESLNGPEQRMFLAKHLDPWALLALQARSRLWRLKQGFGSRRQHGDRGRVPLRT